MSNTDTTTTAAAAAPANSLSTVLANIEAKLSADWQGVVAFLKNEEANSAAFVADVIAGVEVGIEKIIAAGQYIGGHLTIINAATAALAATDPNSATLQKVATDIQTGSVDLAALSQSLTSGSTAGDNQIVTSAASGIAAVQQLTGLLASATSAVASAAASSPTATQSVSPATPNEG